MGTSKALRRKAKNKAAHQKGRKFPPLPPLYWWDHVLYATASLLTAAPIFCILLSTLSSDSYFFQDPEVLAMFHRATELFAFLPAIPAIILLILIACCWNMRRPLLGIPGFRYGRDGGFRADDVPFFRKSAPLTYPNVRKTLRFYRGALAILLATVILLTPVCIPLGAIGRWEFRKQEIVKFSVFNNPLQSFRYSEIQNFTLKTARYSHGRSGGWYYTITLQLNHRSGKVWKLELSDFSEDWALLSLAERLENLGVPMEIDFNQTYWNRFLAETSHDPEFLSQLAELMGIPYTK